MEPAEVIMKDSMNHKPEKVRKPRNRNLRITVCSKESMVDMDNPVTATIQERTINEALDFLIKQKIQSEFGIEVSIRFDWINQHTRVSPCAGDVRFDYSKHKERFRDRDDYRR